MGLQTSGPISLNEIHIEAGGSSGTQAGMNDADIRALIGKNAGTTNSFNEYYGASAEEVRTLSSGATNQNVSTIFGSDFTANVAKRLIINSGVEIGATNTSNYALQVPSGMGGTLIIQNAGTISGAGGAGGQPHTDGQDGYTALYIASNNVTVTNTGTIRGGGGGGGAGHYGSTGGSVSTSVVLCQGGSYGYGGAGGNGQGYNQSQTNGAGGTGGGAKVAYLQSYPGQPNAGPSAIICSNYSQWTDGGSGYTGGNGGTYGNDGSDGQGPSSSGNYQGGDAGKSIQKASSISYALNNTGTLLGPND